MAFYTPAFNLERWKLMLPDPEKRWEGGGSARLLARAWANAKDVPAKVRETFDRSGIDQLRQLEVLLKMPEHPVVLDDPNDPAMNDLFVLARSETSLFTITVTGKRGEPFGPSVGQWAAGESRENRVRVLMKWLGLQNREALGPVSCELLHRAASAVAEAKRYHAGRAMMLVHAFGTDGASFGAYAKFLELFGLKAEQNAVHGLPDPIDGITLYLAWVHDDGPDSVN